jgi:exosortase family protein XrtM
MIVSDARSEGGRDNLRLASFGLKFAVIFGLLFAGYEAARSLPVEELLMHTIVLAPTAAIINRLSATPDVRADGRNIISPGSNLHVTRGCEGVEMFMLLSAGILAFPAGVRRRIRGFLIGVALVYALTLARLVALHFALRYSPGAWDELHGFILPLGPVVLIALYFLHWSAPADSGAAMERGAART